jgi:hypothetical protein
MFLSYEKFEEDYLSGMREFATAHAKACNKISAEPDKLRYSSYSDDLINGATILNIAEEMAALAKSLSENEERPGFFDVKKLDAEMLQRLIWSTNDLRHGASWNCRKAYNWGQVVANYANTNPAFNALRKHRRVAEAEAQNEENRKSLWVVKKRTCKQFRKNRYDEDDKHTYTMNVNKAILWKWDDRPALFHNETLVKWSDAKGDA